MIILSSIIISVMMMMIILVFMKMKVIITRIFIMVAMVLTCDGKPGVGPGGRVPSARTNLTLILCLLSSTCIYNLLDRSIPLLLPLFLPLLVCPLHLLHLQVEDPLAIIAQVKKWSKPGRLWS